MSDHILSARVRFWLGASDIARKLRLPWRLELWLIMRANAALRYDLPPRDVEPGRGPF